MPTLLPPPGLVAIAISKGKLYEALRETGLVPRYRIVSRDELLERRGVELDGGPVWLRDYSDASSSGIGSLQVTEPEEAYAWAYLNPGISSFMVAEHLPGRNIAASLLFQDDELLKAGCYERLEYFMGHLAVSGVTGNINRGRLINDERARTLAEQAVRLVAGLTGEPAHGLLTVDLREDRTGALKVTEINVRHVAATSALADGGANMAEAQVLATLGRLGRDRRDRAPLPRRQRDPARHRRRSAPAYRLPRARSRGARVIVRILVVLALVALLAACGGSKHATPPPATTHAKPKPKPKPEPTHGAHKMTKLVVTILDGDQRERVRGARVKPLGQERSHRSPRRHDDHGAAGAARGLRLGARLCARQHLRSISSAAAGRPSTSTSRSCSGRCTGRPRRAPRRRRRFGCTRRSGSSGAEVSAI